MELETKQQITEALTGWIDEKNQQRSARALSDKTGVNTAYISRIKNGEYEIQSGGGRITAINESHFFKIAEGIGLKLDNDFKWDFINSYKMGYRILRKAHRKQLRTMIDADTGQGKTFVQKWYNRENDYVLLLECTRNMTGKAMINTICTKLGIELANRVTPFEKLELIKKVLTQKRGYIIMIDQAGKAEVKPSIYSVVMDIAVAVEGKAAMVISGYKITEMLNSMYDKHVPGFRQLARRFKSNAYQLPELTASEVEKVCEHEGITNKGAKNVLMKYVKDLDMLALKVRECLDFQEKEGRKITGEEVLDLLNVEILNLKAA
jgi:hypothetical protein